MKIKNNFKDDLVLNKREVKMSNNPVRVTCRVVFLKLGQIDTKNERYDAEGIFKRKSRAKFTIINFFN